MPDGDDITQVGQAQEQVEITNTQEPVAGLNQESDTFFPLPGQENIKEKIISKPYNYSKKAFAIDKGDLRDIESVKKMVKRHYLITDSELGEKIKKTKDGIKRVDGEINPYYTEFFIPLKVDKDKLVGESGSKEHQYYPVEIHDEGLNESQQKKLHKRHKVKRGFFDKIKIKFSSVNLNTDNTLLDEDDLLGDNESMSRRVVKGIARTLIGSRTVRKNFNEEYGKDEPVTQITESSSSDINTAETESTVAVPLQSENNNYENSQYASQIEQAKELGRAFLQKILNFGSIKIGVPFINLTSQGLLMDFMSAVSIQEKYKGLIKSSVIIKFGKKFSLNYLGSELKSNAVKIGSSNSILVNLGSVTLLHDPSTSSDLWEMNEFDLSATILNGTVESKLSASLIEYDSLTGFRIENGDVQGDVKIGGFNGSVRLGGILYENNTLKSFGGIGTLNKIPLTRNFLISDISIVVGYDGSSYIIDGAADIDFNSSLTPIGLEDFHLTGKVNINRDSTNEALNYSLINGNLNASFLDQIINIKNVNYSSKNPNVISAKVFTWAGNILGIDGRLIVINPSIKNGEGFSFSTASGLIQEISYGDYVKIENLGITAEKEDINKYKISGELDTTVNPVIPGLDNGQIAAHFSASGYSDGTEINYSITNGNLNASFLGQDIKIKGVNYSSENPKDITALYASWKGNILDHQGALFILNPKISDDEGFNFKKITGVMYDLNYGQYVTIDFLEIGLEKDGLKYKINGATQMQVNSIPIPGLENTTMRGQFTASGYDDGTEINYSIIEGGLNATLFGNNLVLEGVNYNSLEPTEISARKAKLTLNVFGVGELEPVIKNPRLNDKGFDFDSAEINTANLLKTDLGAFSLEANKFTLINHQSKGYEAKVDGIISLNLGENSPINLAGNAEGAVSYNFKSNTKKVEFQRAEIEIPNPFQFNLPSDLGLPWPIELTMAIPVFPGLNIEVGFYLSGGVQLGQNITVVIENKSNDKLSVELSTNIIGQLLAGILLGAQVGSSFLASLSLRLKAGGELDIDTLVSFVKDFNYNNAVEPSDKPNPKNFLYETDVNVLLDTSLEIVGRLLYFFKKTYNKKIASYNLATYKFTNKDGFDYKNIDTTNQENLTENDSKEQILNKMGVNEGYTFEQIEHMDQSVRFDDNTANEVVGAYDQLNETDDEIKKISFLSSYGKFMQNRINYDTLNSILTADRNITNQVSTQKLKRIVSDLSGAINTKDKFSEQYDSIISKITSTVENNPELNEIIETHRTRNEFYSTANNFKKNNLHSRILGDTTWQRMNLSLFKERFIEQYNSELSEGGFYKNNTKQSLEKKIKTKENAYLKKLNSPNKSSSEQELKNKISESRSRLSS